MKPMFTVHAGEFLVACQIEHDFPKLHVWMPTRDTGVDLLVTDASNTKMVSLQIKLSRDYLVTNLRDEVFHKHLRACGWWTPSRQQIEKKPAALYWVFCLVGFANKSHDYIIIKPEELLTRLDAVHANQPDKFHPYFWVTKDNKCWDTRGLKNEAQMSVVKGTFKNEAREFTAYLNNWAPIRVLNG